MNLPKFFKKALFTLSTLGMAAMLPASALAATVQIEGAIYAKNVTNGTAYSHAGTTAKAGDTVGFQVYYHNLQAPDSGLDANNVRISVNLPTDVAKVHTVSTTIKGDNTNQVDSSTSVTTDTDTKLQFKSDVAVTWRHNTGSNAAPNWVTETIPSTVVTDPNGAIVATLLQPCNNFAATIAFQATVVGQTTPPPAYSCDAFSIVADVNRKIKVTNFATSASNGAAFSSADINWGDSSTQSTGLTSVIGQTHQYSKDGSYTVTATAHFNVNGQDKTDSGPECVKQITVKTTPEMPIYTCDTFSITADVNRVVKVTAFSTTTKNGAKFNSVDINWGDNSPLLTGVTNPIGKTHQFDKNKDATYTIVATAHFTVDGKDVTDSGVECAKQIAFKGEQPPVITPPVTITPVTPVTPGTTVGPTKLVNTGPGSIAGLFAVVAAAGTLAHRRFLSRRLGTQ